MRSFAASTGLLWKTVCCAPIPPNPPSLRDKGLGLGRADVRAVAPFPPRGLGQQALARKEWGRLPWVTVRRGAPANPMAACGGRTTQADPRVRSPKSWPRPCKLGSATTGFGARHKYVPSRSGVLVFVFNFG